MGNNNKGNLILLTILSVATLLVAVVGATFAYFNVSMNGKDSETTIEVTNGTLSTEYVDNSTFNFTGGTAGQLIASKTFTINGLITGSSNLNYQVVLKVNNNTYGEGQLVYAVRSSNDSNNGTVIPNNEDRVSIPVGTNNVIVGKGLFAGPIPNGALHTYTIDIYAMDGATIAADAAFDAKVAITQATK